METTILPVWVIEVGIVAILALLGIEKGNGIVRRIGSGTTTTKGRRPSGNNSTLQVEVAALTKDVEELKEDVKDIGSTLQKVETGLALLGQRLDLRE